MVEYKGKKFKDYLERNNIPVSTAAKKIEVSRNALYQYFESDELSLKVVKKIITGLGTTEHSIWGDAPVASDFSSSEKLYSHRTDNPKSGIPMYNVTATAGVVGVYEDTFNEEPMFYLDVPGARDCDFGVRISGDSMYPRFRNGDWIGCKEVKNREYILYGEVYYIITSDYKTVKYIQPHSTKDDWVMLVPHNDSIKPTPLPKSEIIKLFTVKVNLQIF